MPETFVEGTSDYPVRYVRQDTKPGEVREIVIYVDRKLRRFNDGTSNGRLDLHWVLYRADVPNLTDEDWYSAPSFEGGWSLNG